MIDGRLRRHGEAKRAHEMADDGGALRRLERRVLVPAGNAKLELPGEPAGFDEAVAPGRAMDAVKLAAQRRDRLRRGRVDPELTRQILQQCNCPRAGLAEALAQRA